MVSGLRRQAARCRRPAEASIDTRGTTRNGSVPPQDAGDGGWIRIDTKLQYREPRLGVLLDYWNAKRGPRAMPSRGEIRPAELPRLLKNVFLVDIEPVPLRLRYRLIGSALTEAVGRDRTGHCFDEVYPPAVMARIEEAYRWMMAQRAPVRTYGRAIHFQLGFYDYEALHLPLSPDDDRVTMVVGGLFFTIPEGR